MIGKLTGRFEGAGSDGTVIVAVNGVGYVVRVPAATHLIIQTAPGADLSLFIHTAVREDAIDLYGFSLQEELSFFKQLLDVSGIGPKTALGVLNVSDVSTLKRSIAAGDATVLTKVFGIGKKSAERIVVELRDKFGKETGVAVGEGEHGGDAEVIEALMALGYNALESRGALKEVGKKVVGTRERISKALQILGSRVIS